MKHVYIIYEMSHQSRFDARYWMLGAGALGRPRGMVWGRRREEGSGWGTHVYLWRTHFDVWQNQYNIVKFKNKIKGKMKKKTKQCPPLYQKKINILFFLLAAGYADCNKWQVGEHSLFRAF